MMEYPVEDYLSLSGIQHIAFCERQWALIHIEQQWIENLLTIEGHHLHEKVDDPFNVENKNNNNIIILRAVSVISNKLGLYGRADVVELIRIENNDANNSIKIKDRNGWWKVVPVEYKRGKPKSNKCDEVQLCAQAICLEEMYNINIAWGWLYYGKIRHRFGIEFNGELRRMVKDYAIRMHKLFDERKTPGPIFNKQCQLCSLRELCLPEALSNSPSVSKYLKEFLYQ